MTKNQRIYTLIRFRALLIQNVLVTWKIGQSK